MMKPWRDLGGAGKVRFVLALGLSALAGASGVALLGLSGWFLTASALAGFAGAGLLFNHLIPSASIRGLAITRVLARYGEQLVGHAATLRFSAVLRPSVFECEALASRGMRALPAGELAGLIDDVDAVEGGFLRVVSPSMAVCASSLVAVGWTAAVDIVMAWVTAGGLLLFGLCLPWMVSIRTRRLAEELSGRQKAVREDISHLVENALELDSLNVLGAEIRAGLGQMERLSASVESLEAPHRLASAVSSISGGVLALGLLLRVQGGSDAALAAGACLSLIAAFETCGSMLRAMDAAPRAVVASRRLAERLGRRGEPQDPPLESAIALSGVLPLVCREVSSRSSDGAPLHFPVDLECTTGSVTEIIGPSGAGKTMFLETLARLRPCGTGAILYAGIDSLAVRTASVLAYASLSPQFPDFTSVTVRDALCVGRPDASLIEVEAALRIACADDFIRSHPRGLDADIETFSGGERRRLGLARALVCSPQLLLLDEPFSGLQPDLASRLADSLASWVADGERAIVLTRHELMDFAWRGVHTTRLAIRPVMRSFS